ncbi:MarR family winged helix-turn-helix transcriptional regulator [Saccharothrix variisporea]|uniref:DNA-binding MarR family transcriptional regulator n=1 Tax=Saccharothrix variisporea TaxID=543527 RepID=A0A495X7A4_9PSEU|nr:MarR family transcriptional regulator [Saccharothrix variisporea]RKT67398.1 DNA-binding MarR family transcriptional regulator [Saccharothrix variisporea]
METTGAPARLRGRPSWLLNSAALQATRLVNDGFAAVGARRYHYKLLATLEEFGPASQADLSRRGGVDRSDVVAAVNEMAERGFVERAVDPADRRRNIVTITEAGTRHLGHLDEVLAGAQDALLAPLSAAEREDLVGMLSRIVEHHS